MRGVRGEDRGISRRARALPGARATAERYAAVRRSRGKEAEEVLAKARLQAEATFAKVREEHGGLLAEIDRLKEVREEYAMSFRALLLAALETLDRGDAAIPEVSEPVVAAVQAQGS